MDRKKLIDELNYALTTEYQAYIQYLSHAEIQKGFDGEAVRELLTHISEEELKHAKILRERIVALGGTPSMDIAPRKKAVAPKEVLKLNIGEETEAIEIYTRILKMIGDDDVMLQHEIRHILKDEIEHKEELMRLLG